MSSTFYTLKGQGDQFSFVHNKRKGPEELKLFREYNKLLLKRKVFKRRSPATRHEKDALKEQMFELKRQIWVAKGVRKHNLDEDRLEFVIQRFRGIGKVPKGYLFPELISRADAPAEMQAML